MASGRTPQALALFKPFVAANSLAKIEGKSAVLVLGRMGAGKSTAISIQLGAEWKEVVDKDGEVKLELQSCPVPIPKVSDGFMSTTLNVGVYEDGGMTYLDTAGLNENRGPDTRLWTTWSCSTVFSLLRQVSATLVVFDFSSALGGDRGVGVRDLAECLHKMVGSGSSSKHFYDSMVFLVTNPFKGRHRISVSTVTTAASHILEAEKVSLQALTARLPKLEQTLREAFKGHASSMVTGEQHIMIDWAKVSEKDLQDYNLRTCTVRLMDALAKAGDRIVLSYPSSPRECRAQRQELTRRLRFATCITKEALTAIVEARETESFEMCGALAELGALYSGDLERQSEILEKLYNLFESQYEDVRAMESDWQAVRERLVASAEARKREHERHETEAWAERETLNKSTKLKPLIVKEVRQARGACGNPLSWFVGAYKWARAEYVYDGDWFHSHTCTGSHFSKQKEKCEPSEGKLSIVFESACGYDIKSDVKINRYEKDLPTTKARIADLDSQIKRLKREIACQEKEIMHLKAADSKENLMNIVMKANEGLQRELETIERKLKQEVPDVPQGPNGKMLEGHVLEELVRVFSLLKRTPGAISKDIGAGTRATIDELIQRHERVQEYKKKVQVNEVVRKYIGFADHAKSGHEVIETMAARRAGPVGKLQDVTESSVDVVGQWLSGVVAGLISSGMDMCVHSRDELKISFGVAVLFFALCRNVVVGFGVFFITSGAIELIHKFAQRGERLVEFLPRAFVEPLLGVINAQGERLENVGNRFAESVNVDINFDSIFG